MRWTAGERLHEVIAAQVARAPDRIAVDPEGGRLVSYAALFDRATALAAHIAAMGAIPNSRVGLMFDRQVEGYAALLAVSMADAAFVPLDASFPDERLAFIARDAELSLIVTTRSFAERLAPLGLPLLLADEIASGSTVIGMPARSDDPDPLAYIIYTSGTTGTPKGVAVAHSSICNFVRVAADVYRLSPDDRMYQGLTIAFDFSFEEILVPLAVGATLVPGRTGAQLVGGDLHDFLVDRRVTALCCVPTVLATLPADLPGLRWLLVSGEACPQDLVRRWHRDDRVMLNAYGPTETAVTSSLAELHPDRAVTIGAPLPTYTMVILHEDRLVELPRGAVGEIGIAGICVARGYLNQPELTEAKFVPDTIGLPDNPGGRIYRSGDLGQIGADGEIVYLGRIDSQVKMRGYRIELGEIETAVMAWPGVAQAVVNPHATDSGESELVAYVTHAPGAAPIDRAALAAALAERLPRYMVPAFIEELAAIPLSPAQKVDRRALPAPLSPRLARVTDYHSPADKIEAALAEALHTVLGGDPPSTRAHFFDELGAHSLLMARFCATARAARPDLDIAMRDVYAHTTIAALATAVRDRVDASGDDGPPPPALPTHRATARQHIVAGTLQALFYVLLACAQFALAVEAITWVMAAETDLMLATRAIGAMFGIGLLLILLPILAKWLLIGRFRPGSLPIWTLAYVRFWIVRELIQHNPITLFRGTILYNLFLNALGARVALSAYLSPERVPVATDLLTVGADTVLQQHSLCATYRAEAGHIRFAPVTIGRNVNIGINAVIDVGVTIEDGARLAHSGGVHEGQLLRCDTCYGGAPAVPSDASPALDEVRPCGFARRIGYAAGSIAVQTFVFAVPLILIGIVARHYALFREIAIGPDHAGVPLHWVEPAIWAVAAYAAGIAAALAVAAIVPRAAMAFVVPGRVYPLYGIAWSMLSLARTTSNVPYLHAIFGDSSYMVHYLRWIGYRLGRVEQTGSNFGIAMAHDASTLCHVGSGTMVSDGLFISNVRQSGSAFRADQTRIGENSYFGNNLVFPSTARTGANVLYATKVQVPVSGEILSDTGLLGAPAFAIPRTSGRDAAAIAALSEVQRRAGLRRKNRVNTATIAALLLAHALYFAGLAILFAAAHDFYINGNAVWVVAVAVMPVVTAVYFILVERASLGFRRIAPAICSIYDTPFLAVERYWKLNTSPLAQAARGTPFRPLILRAAGVRIGRRVFDDGCVMTEKTLVEIGDFATLGDNATLQSHSLEEGVFKCDAVRIGADATIGQRALVHYGTLLGAVCRVAPGAFVMKGEIDEEGSLWRGNPARPA